MSPAHHRPPEPLTRTGLRLLRPVVRPSLMADQIVQSRSARFASADALLNGFDEASRK